jgi:hypothetical protein
VPRKRTQILKSTMTERYGRVKESRRALKHEGNSSKDAQQGTEFTVQSMW